MAGTNPVDFLKRHSSEWPLVMPKACVDKILAVPDWGDWASVAAELREAYQSGPLGAKIFGFAVSMVLDTHIQSIMHEELRKLAAKPHIRVQDVLECKRAINQSIETLPGVDTVLWVKGGLQKHLQLTCCKVLQGFEQ
jgi:hypothetical protein